MKQEIFKVNNFIFHKLPSNECVVQNKKGLVKITHENLIALIQYMEKSRLTNIEYNDIEQFLKEEINEGINFLNHFGIIETKKRL